MRIPSFLRPVIAPGDVSRERHVKTFRAEIEAAAAAADRARLEALLERPKQLGLADEDAELECEHLAGLLAAADLREHLARGDPLEVIPTQHSAIAGERCHFLAPASFPDGLMDQGGKLFLTDARVLYLGHSRHEAAWPHVSEVRDQDRDVFLTVRPLDLLRFRFNSYVDALRAAEIARHLSRAARAARG
ncbi:MAG: hypothetical protein H6Q10_3328 [Acidobacteria bacterium]|nr:hypothetical protein [Acidobacteriota bacterium]